MLISKQIGHRARVLQLILIAGISINKINYRSEKRSIGGKQLSHTTLQLSFLMVKSSQTAFALDLSLIEESEGSTVIAKGSEVHDVQLIYWKLR